MEARLDGVIVLRSRARLASLSIHASVFSPSKALWKSPMPKQPLRQ
jgi:hypothetical protein